MRVLGISGSLRRDSYNSGLLRAAAELLPSGVELEVFDALKAIPAYDADDDVQPAPAPVASLREAIAEADVIFFLTDGRAGLSPQDQRIAQELREAHAKLDVGIECGSCS